MFNALLIIILTIGIVFVTLGYLKSEMNCPPPKIIYRLINNTPVDYQFSEANFPSKAYENLFTEDNITVGGYKLSSGRTVNSTPKK